MDRFATLAAFVKVVEMQGFASAARRMGVSPSAVTRLVAALEDHLGVRLLQRTTRSVSLTDEGERYLLQAQRILAELGEADASMQAGRTAPFGRLVLSAPLVFGRVHVGPLLSAYLTRFPQVHGELLLGDRIVSLIEEGVDIAVRIGELTDSSLRSRRVGETRRVVVASPNYLSRYGMPSDPAALSRHRCIHFSGFGGGSEWEFEHGGVRSRVPVNPSFVTNSADSAIQHALSGGGLTTVLAYQAEDAIRTGALVVVLSAYERPPLPIQLVYPTSRLLAAKVRAFIDMVAKDTHWSFIELG